jgi:hypothetical protein
MIREFVYENLQGDKVHMIEIVDENGNATQMLKATYEAQQAEQSTPNVAE